MKKTLLAVLATAALTLGAQAVPITGDIDFAGQATFDTTSLATATRVTLFKANDLAANNTGTVTSANGSFSSIAPGTLATMNPYTFNPSTAVTPLWTVGGFSFNLTSSTIVAQSSFSLVVRGTGFITSTNPSFDTTPGVWIFSAGQANGGTAASFSFQANTAAVGVPDGGSTVALLGAGLIGVVALRRKFAKA